jgi:hypothetical protein
MDLGFSSMKIQTLERAYSLVRQVAWAFIVVGILQLGVSLLVPELFDGVFDAGLFILFGALFGLKPRLWLGVVLLLLSAAAVGFTVWNKFSGAMGGQNVILSLIILYAGIQALNAAWYVHKRFNEREPSVSRWQRWLFVAFAWLAGLGLLIVIALIVLGIFFAMPELPLPEAPFPDITALRLEF